MTKTYTERLTHQERELVTTWRKLASTYRHGDCGRRSHVGLGCDVVCLYSHGQGNANLPEPWKVSYRRPTTDLNNQVVERMVDLVMNAVPKVVSASA